ncbi:MAG: DUF1837 domain-containing protein [Luteolibacter sp.]
MSNEFPEDSLQNYLEASRDSYKACLDKITSSLLIDGHQVTLDFQHVRFDANGEPKFDDLAKCLADHVIEYCFSMRRRGTPTSPNEFSRLNREARGLLRKFGTSGEAGEMLLYFLLETVYSAPQIVAKMDLKTNPRMELHGSDGIHMKWNRQDELLDIFFGESKLETKVSSAISNAFSSLKEFHDNGLRDHEFGLVTSHFKLLDDVTRDIVFRFLDRRVPGGDCRINHACLIGYDWSKYKQLFDHRRNDFIINFKNTYIRHSPSLAKLLKKKLDQYGRPQLRLLIFFLPFQSVQEFRNAFNKAVG